MGVFSNRLFFLSASTDFSLREPSKKKKKKKKEQVFDSKMVFRFKKRGIACKATMDFGLLILDLN